jgi:hypothetical protein
MSNLDRLEVKWLRLREELHEGRAKLAALTSALNVKREEFEKVDAVRDLVRQGDGSSATLVDQALDELEAATEESPTDRPTQADMVLQYVYASPSKNGVTAREVAKALYSRGYGSGTNWKNFYTSITVSLTRWVKRGAIEEGVLLHGRNTKHFTPPRSWHDTTMPEKRVRPWDVPLDLASAPAKNQPSAASPEATVTVPDRHESPPAEQSGAAAVFGMQEPPPASPSASVTISDGLEPLPAELSGAGTVSEMQEPPPASPSASVSVSDSHEPLPAERSGAAAVAEMQEPLSAPLSDAVVASATGGPTSAPPSDNVTELEKTEAH